MPNYLFEHPVTKEIVTVFQRINDEHVYSKDGVVYDRIFTVPTASIDTKIDPFSSKDFAEKTGKKKGTLGDLYDQSREASDKRAKIQGKDPVKEKFWKDYSDKRGGRVHPDSLK